MHRDEVTMEATNNEALIELPQEQAVVWVVIRQASISYDTDYLKLISRLSNNFVENYIGQKQKIYLTIEYFRVDL